MAKIQSCKTTGIVDRPGSHRQNGDVSAGNQCFNLLHMLHVRHTQILIDFVFHCKIPQAFRNTVCRCQGISVGHQKKGMGKPIVPQNLPYLMHQPGSNPYIFNGGRMWSAAVTFCPEGLYNFHNIIHSCISIQSIEFF